MRCYSFDKEREKKHEQVVGLVNLNKSPRNKTSQAMSRMDVRGRM